MLGEKAPAVYLYSNTIRVTWSCMTTHPPLLVIETTKDVCYCNDNRYFNKFGMVTSLFFSHILNVDLTNRKFDDESIWWYMCIITIAYTLNVVMVYGGQNFVLMCQFIHNVMHKELIPCSFNSNHLQYFRDSD